MADKTEREWPDFLHKLKELKHQVRPLESKRAGEYELFLVDLSEWKLQLSAYTPLIWVKAEMSRRYPPPELAVSLRDIATERGWRNQVCLVLLDSEAQDLRAEMAGWYFPRFVIIDENERRRILVATSPTFATQESLREQLPLSSLSPYQVGGSVEGSRFFGREVEIHRVLGRPGTNFAITGVRRIGKTSLMREIRRRMIEHGEAEERSVWLDCSTLGNRGQFEQEIVRQLNPRELTRLSRTFHFDLTDFLKRMRKMHGGRITIFLDEVDKMIVWARDDLSTIMRASANTGDCRYILAGFQQLMSETYNDKSPLYQALELVRLGPFEKKETEDIVLRPMRSLRIRFENELEVVGRIYSDTHGNPLLVQYYCTELINKLERSGARSINLESLNGVYRAKGFKDQVLKSFNENVDPADKLLVYALLSHQKNKEGFTQAEMYGATRRHNVAMSPDEVYRACDRLELAGVLVCSGLRYEFALPIFPHTLRANSDLDYLLSATKREVGS